MPARPVTHDQAFIEARSIPEPNSGCWLWLGERDTYGYGYCSVPLQYRIGEDTSKRRRDLAHRISYRVFKGPIPDGRFIRHRCDNPPCCNPDHLECGTPKENSGDMVRRGRASFGERNGVAKLTDDQVREIRELFCSKHRVVEIAERFGVTWSRIYQLRRGEGWQHAG